MTHRRARSVTGIGARVSTTIIVTFTVGVATVAAVEASISKMAHLESGGIRVGELGY